MRIALLGAPAGGIPEPVRRGVGARGGFGAGGPWRMGSPRRGGSGTWFRGWWGAVG